VCCCLDLVFIPSLVVVCRIVVFVVVDHWLLLFHCCFVVVLSLLFDSDRWQARPISTEAIEISSLEATTLFDSCQKVMLLFVVCCLLFSIVVDIVFVLF
jgi:hypothetical protein